METPQNIKPGRFGKCSTRRDRQAPREAPSAPWRTQQKGKENSRKEEEGDNERNLVLGRLRRLPERFGGQEADQQGTIHDGGNPVRGGG